MAILKHIASKSSNYGAALEYLIFKHDEYRKTPILDKNGNRIMRDEFYLDGLNCEPYSFDAACQQLNREYQKNKNKNEIKSHHADGNMSKEEFIRQRDAYRVQEDERMEQIQRLRTEKDQIFQPVKKDTDNLQAMMNTVGEAGDVMHLSQNVVEAFIDRIEVFNDERVKIHFTFEDVLADHAE